jgi:uncharacterized protein YpmS
LFKATLDLTSSSIATLEEYRVYLKNKVHASIHCIVTHINVELQIHPNELSKGVVMEKLMGSSMVTPHLPYYYLSILNTKVQHAFVQGLKTKLQEMKGVQSKEKLECKGTLLNVALSKEITRVRALTIVLETNPMNINFVV